MSESAQITNQGSAEEPPLHPALVYLGIAIAMFKRADCQEEADIFTTWIICNFDAGQWVKALTQGKQDLPVRVSAREDYKYAHECLDKVKSELARKEVQGDTLAMWREEVDKYNERLKKRQDAREAERAEQAEKKSSWKFWPL